MDLQRLTQKSQEGFQNAQSIAARYGHQELDVEHLLSAFVADSDGILTKILSKMSISRDVFTEKLNQLLEKRPRITGPGAEVGKIYVTNKLNKIMALA